MSLDIRKYEPKEAKPIEFDGRNYICVAAFSPDGKHIVSGGYEAKIRRWRVMDGQVVGTPMDTAKPVSGLAISRDGKWIVSGTVVGHVTVWDADNHGEVRTWRAHSRGVRAVDVSADGTKIVSGSRDKNAALWSLSTGERLFQWKHDDAVVAAKFSPDQLLVATGSFHVSVRIYDSQDGHLVADAPIKVNSWFNCSLAWSGDSKKLFALSRDGIIRCIDASTGTTLTQWSIHSINDPICISLANNGTFIAASTDSSVSFWDTAAHEQIGSVVEYSIPVASMAISESLDFVTAAGEKISVWSLRNILPSRYCNTLHSTKADLEEATLSNNRDLEKIIEQLWNQLSNSRNAFYQKEKELEESEKTMQQLRDELESLQARSNKEITCHNETIQQLRAELADSNNLIRAHEIIYESEILYAEDRTTEAALSLREIVNNVRVDVRADSFVTSKLADLTRRCVRKLEMLGDATMNSKNYNISVQHYSDALSLDPDNRCEILIKRSRAWTLLNSWDMALADADEAIKLDPENLLGHESKHTALLCARRYDEAIDAYSDMLENLEKSPNILVRELRKDFVTPSETIAVIRSSFDRTQQDMPLVLIDTETGILRNARERWADFEANTAFKRLVASTTKLVDHDHIDHVIQRYLRYAMFSHTWDSANPEPSFQHVHPKSVHGLEQSPTVSKLKTFCQIVLGADLRWAWSDTCCIDKMDGPVLQESLVSMFKWYHNSALTVVHLKGVSTLHTLVECPWNTRAWTLQEFFASRVIRFYSEDWKVYVPCETMYNHKESAVIMAEMAAATGVNAQVLLSLRPGSNNIRQKLRLAATRVATKQEDIAYSLFGIFDVALSVTYGEGQEFALGRLLQEVLTRSGDVTILSWSGRASKYNSCLPADITVYREPTSPKVPILLEGDELDTLIEKLQTFPGTYLDMVVALYDRVSGLQSARLVSQRLTLSCIKLPLGGLTTAIGDVQCIYRASTPAIGNVEVITKEDLTHMKNLVLVHPWLRCLLDDVPSFEDHITDSVGALISLDNDNASASGPSQIACAPSTSSHRPAETQPDKQTYALRFFARLKQPFGALLLAPLSPIEYKRVASDCAIMVQFLPNVSPRYLAERIQTIEVL